MIKPILITLAIFALIPIAYVLTTGSGGFKRMVTLSGIYAVCKPEKYPVVCFMDADGKEGGLFCMKLEDAGGKCL